MIKCTQKNYARRGLPRLPPERLCTAALADTLLARASAVRDGLPRLPPVGPADTTFGSSERGRPLLPPERTCASPLSWSL